MQSKNLIRNNTSFPIQITAKLKQLYEEYTNEDNNSLKKSWSKILKYYQYLIKELISNSDFTEKEYARGLLIYHEMGMGKTRLAVAVTMSMWDTHQPVIILPHGLKKNFKKTIAEVIKLLYSSSNEESLSKMIEEAFDKFHFISMDAYNSSAQLSKVQSKEKSKKSKEFKKSKESNINDESKKSK